MKSEAQSVVKIREIVFDNDDFFDQEKMIKNLDRLVYAWGLELVLEKGNGVQYLEIRNVDHGVYELFLSVTPVLFFCEKFIPIWKTRPSGPG